MYLLVNDKEWTRLPEHWFQEEFADVIVNLYRHKI